MFNFKPIYNQLTVKPALDCDLAGIPAVIIGRCANTGQFELLFVEGSKIMATPEQIDILGVDIGAHGV